MHSPTDRLYMCRSEVHILGEMALPTWEAIDCPMGIAQVYLRGNSDLSFRPSSRQAHVFANKIDIKSGGGWRGMVEWLLLEER